MTTPIIETDPADWLLSGHALQRARQRFGPACTRAALRLVLEQADGWQQLEGDLAAPDSRVLLASRDIPGVRFVIGWDYDRPTAALSGRHVLVTILEDARPRIPVVNGSSDSAARKVARRLARQHNAGRTTPERYRRLKWGKGEGG